MPGNKHSGGKSKLETHPDRAVIESDWVLKRRKLQEIAADVGMHESSVSRFFKTNLTEERRREIIAEDRIARAEKINGMLSDERLDVARTYETLAKRVDRIVTRAEENEDDAFALAGLESLRKVLKDIASMQKLLSDNLTVTVALTDAPEWLRIRAVFRELVDVYPEIRPTLLRLLNEEKLSITEGDSSAGI